MSLLEVRELVKDFGGLRSVSEFDMDVQEGEILGFIGPNGSGKTTVFNMISGFLKPTHGSVRFRDEEIVGLKPHVISRMGLVRTFQREVLFSRLTVMDSMRVALHRDYRTGLFRAAIGTRTAQAAERAIDEKALEILKHVGMDSLVDQECMTLSHGLQRTLGLAQNLATGPSLALLDEPLAGLNPDRVKKLLELIREFRDGGGTVVLVEHRFNAIYEVCDRIAVIASGKKIAEGTPAEIANDPVVIKAYLGTTKHVA